MEIEDKPTYYAIMSWGNWHGEKKKREEKQTWINNMYVRQKKMTPNHTADVSVTPTQ